MNPDFKKGEGLITVIIQDSLTQQVLMLGYMNEEAFSKTKKEGIVTFYSRSKNRLWTKGETSGNFLKVTELFLDCDEDTILIKVIPEGPTCHTGEKSCFKNNSSKGFIYQLEKTIDSKISNDESNSYTNELFKKGINKVAQKVGEEAVELVIESKDNNDELFLNEAADLMYHYLILLRAKNKSLGEVEEVLMKRVK